MSHRIPTCITAGSVDSGAMGTGKRSSRKKTVKIGALNRRAKIWRGLYLEIGEGGYSSRRGIEVGESVIRKVIGTYYFMMFVFSCMCTYIHRIV